ncbi:MAG: hypothetical protein ACMG6E_06615, partial [Candidatus Roizmanbacteria bacterium]
MDYVCVAMIQYQRKALLESDYIDCLKIMMNYPKLECAADIIKISERVRKLLFDKQVKQQKQVLEVNTFPQMIEKQDYQFTCIMDQANSNDNSTDQEEGNTYTHKEGNMYFQVNEEELEEEEDEEENKALDSVKA